MRNPTGSSNVVPKALALCHMQHPHRDISDALRNVIWHEVPIFKQLNSGPGSYVVGWHSWNRNLGVWPWVFFFCLQKFTDGGTCADLFWMDCAVPCFLITSIWLLSLLLPMQVIALEGKFFHFEKLNCYFLYFPVLPALQIQRVKCRLQQEASGRFHCFKAWIGCTLAYTTCCHFTCKALVGSLDFPLSGEIPGQLGPEGPAGSEALFEYCRKLSAAELVGSAEHVALWTSTSSC